MGTKKYYWLKLKNDFFKNKKMKKLRKVAGGDTYTIIYLKMQLLSLTNEGKLYFENVEDSFAEELALELDEEVENVKITLMFLVKNGLLVTINEEEFLLPETLECIGSETSKAELMRKKRAKEKVLGNNVTNVLPEVAQSYTEKEKELEEDIDIELKKKKEKDGRPMDVQEYFANAELNSIFLEFIEVRKKLKAVNSDRAIKTLINKLNKYPDNVKYQMIENSIVNSWKDVYELKEKRTTSYQKPIRQEEVPEWINKEIKKEEMTQDELDEMDELLKDFKEPYKPNPELQERLKSKYGKKKSL